MLVSRRTPPRWIYTLSLHDALPISQLQRDLGRPGHGGQPLRPRRGAVDLLQGPRHEDAGTELFQPARQRDRDILRPRERSEEHTSELQSLRHLVCRLLLEKKKTKYQ